MPSYPYDEVKYITEHFILRIDRLNDY